VGAYCLGLKDVVCTAPSCQLGGNGTVDEAACRRGYDHACPLYQDDINALAADGQVQFNAAEATSCINGYRVFGPSFSAFQCLDPGSPNYAYQVYDSFYGTVSCTGGLSTVTLGLFARAATDSCSRVFAGTRTGASMCGGNDVCVTGNCDGLTDAGGCGTCRVEDAGTPSSPDAGVPAAVGAPCTTRDDAGFNISSDCVSGSTCDSRTTGLCLAYVGADGTCGPGTNHTCSAMCGYHCSNQDGGTGTCVTNPTVGQGCSAVGGVPCQDGLGCVASTDAGYPDYSTGTCRVYAALGEACSDGTNFEQFPPVARMGFGSFGRGPANICGRELRCSVPDGGSVGSCVDDSPAATGAPCRSAKYPPCRTLGDHCQDVDGGSVCVAPAAAGGTCGQDADCAFNLFCSAGTCSRIPTAGEDCGSTNRCASGLGCFHGTCLNLETLVAPLATTPLCR
jgi:hypothetical protein